MRLLKDVQNSMGNYHVKSGIYHYNRNEYTKAIDFLRKAAADAELPEPERRNARYYLTLALVDLAQRLASGEDLEGGVERLRQAAEVSPDYPDIHHRLGEMLEQIGRLDEAIAEHRAAAACQADYLDAHVALGFCLLKQNRREEAAAAFRQALAIKQQKVEVPFEEGLAALERGDAARASELMHEVFLAVPQLASACLRKALEWLKAEEHEKALAELDRALERNPNYPDLHNFRGVVLSELERVDEAVLAFRESIELAPRFIVPRLNLAFILARVGEYRDAEAELEAILALDPHERVAAAKLDELRSGSGPDSRRKTTRGSAR
jgi:tetratricopeptide (TPR) repeat protein